MVKNVRTAFEQSFHALYVTDYERALQRLRDIKDVVGKFTKLMQFTMAA